jgi:hypothetical protein
MRDCNAKPGATPTLNFGDSLPRLVQRTLRLTVHSLSGIASDVALSVQTFPEPDARAQEDLEAQLAMQAVRFLCLLAFCSEQMVWVVVWWCGGVVVWWCGGVVVWWCGGVVVVWCGCCGSMVCAVCVVVCVLRTT